MTTSPAERDSISDLLAAYVLHAVTADEAAAVKQHLPMCAACQRELQELSIFQELLPELTPAIDPPPSLKARLMDQIRREAADPQPQAVEGMPGWPANLSTLRVMQPQDHVRPHDPEVEVGRPAPLPPTTITAPRVQRPGPVRQSRTLIYSLATVAAIVVILVGIVAAYQHSRQPATSPGQLVASIAGQPASLGTHGSLTYYSAGRWAELQMQGLRSLPQTKVYEFWLINGEGALPSGTFRPQSDGTANLRIYRDVRLFTQVGVTIEQTGGSKTPTLPIVAAGGVKL